jgi:hypothetical protein
MILHFFISKSLYCAYSVWQSHFIFTVTFFVIFKWCYTEIFPPCTTVTFWKVQHKSNFALVGNDYRCGQLYIYTQGSPVETWSPVYWSLISQTTCAVTQQYSSCIFVSFHFYSWKEIMAYVKQYYFSWVPTSMPHCLHITYSLFQPVCHTTYTSPTRYTITHHITAPSITPHRINKFISQDINLYPFVTCI